MDAANGNLVLVAWNCTDRPYPLDKTLVDSLTPVAAAPLTAAVEYDGRLWIPHFDGWANRVAHDRWRSHDISLNHRPFELVVESAPHRRGLLPVAAQNPAERRAWMLKNAKSRPCGSSSDGPHPGVRVGDGVAGTEPATDRQRSVPFGLATIYTSGSTGMPKGVVVAT